MTRSTPLLVLCASLLGLACWGSPLWTAIASQERWPEGLITQLVSLESAYVLGKPMKFRVQITNNSHAPIPYSPYAEAYAGSNDPLLVHGPNGNSPYIGPWGLNQEIMGAKSPSLDPGVVVTLFEFDLSDYYYIDRPGRYAIQYRKYHVPPSNDLEVDIQPGTLSQEDVIVGRLLEVLPQLPHFSKSSVLEKMQPDDQRRVDVSKHDWVAGTMLSDAPIHETRSVAVYVTRRPVALTTSSDRPGRPLEALGMSQWGQVYLQIFQWTSIFPSREEMRSSPDAEAFSREAKAFIQRALDIKPTGSPYQ